MFRKRNKGQKLLSLLLSLLLLAGVMPTAVLPVFADEVNTEQCLTLSTTDDGDFTVTFPGKDGHYDGTLQYYDRDNGAWTNFPEYSFDLSFTKDKALYIRGQGNTYVNGDYSNSFFVISKDEDEDDYTEPMEFDDEEYFEPWEKDGSVEVTGNIMTLLDYENPDKAVMGNNCFECMFYECTVLTKAPDLPATTLADCCYQSMFDGCTSLTVAPDLPATTLAAKCYEYMFYDCVSLTEAPELKATTLAEDCCYEMFYDCTSLIKAPALPATELAEGCYYEMFSGCISLTEAPELPATTLATECYDYMFYNCVALTEAPELKATTLADYCYYEMFCGCTSLTEAPALPATELAEGCYEEMFCGCTSLTEAPELPATTLAEGCYSYMFDNCTSLTEAPELKATTLADYCYYEMFYGCTSLTEAPELKATELAEGCYSGMFFGCTSLTEAPELPATTLADYCYCGMFANCILLTTAPELKATELAESCYESMFNGCILLTEAPELKSTKLAKECYRDMFNGCTSLTEAPVLPATELANGCYYAMFYNCSSLFEAPVLPATEAADCCYYDMFYGCTSLTTAPELKATRLAKECYRDMFAYCSLLTVPPVLSVTELADGCYCSMFAHCTSLAVAPELPATTLAAECYEYMFYDCVALTEAPELKATVLKEKCYRDMFHGCTSLTQAPELPATELAQGCYDVMFSYCSSLIEAPELKAAVLADNCYYEMFNGCTSLVKAPALPATALKKECYNKMFGNCTSLTELPLISATAFAEKSCYQMFLNCSGIEMTDSVSEENLSDYNTVSFPINSNDSATEMFEGTTGNVSTPECDKTYYVRNQRTQENSEAALAVDNLIDAIGTVTDTQECKTNIDTAAEAYQQLNSAAKAMVTKIFVLTAAQAAYAKLGAAAAAAEVDTLIDAIGTVTYTDDCRQKIDTAAEAYHQLTPIATTKVTKLSVLVKAQAAYKQMDEIHAAAEVDALIDAIGIVTYTEECENKIDAAFDAYENLTPFAKTKVTKLPELLAAGEEYYIKMDESAAAEVDTLIDAIGTVTYTDECRQKIDTAADAYDQLTDEAKAMVTQYDVLTAAQAEYAQLEAAAEFDGEHCLTLSTPEDYDITVTFPKKSGHYNGTLQYYNYDTEAWTTFPENSFSLTFNKDTALHIRGKGNTYVHNDYSEAFFGMYAIGFVEANGNIMTLLDYENPDSAVMAKECFHSMFHSCVALIKAPVLPATVLSDSCYEEMFSECTALTVPPALPATELKKECYYGMFWDCTSLYKIPSLPAAVIESGCYDNMFAGCTSIEITDSIPEGKESEYFSFVLPSSSAYRNMFGNTTGNVESPVGGKTYYIKNIRTDQNLCIAGMMDTMIECTDVSSVTDECKRNIRALTICYGDLEPQVQKLVTKLSVVRKAQTDYVEKCNDTALDINKCLTLSTEDEDEFTVVFPQKKDSYDGVLQYYDNNAAEWKFFPLNSFTLTFSKENPLHIRGQFNSYVRSDTYYGFFGIYGDGKVNAGGNVMTLLDYEAPDTVTMKEKCFKRLFCNCSVLAKAPELPATELAEGCYEEMFYDCTSLTKTPDLPATELAENCYYAMFNGCSSLIEAPALSATELADNCYEEMFYECTSLTEAPKLPATELADYCYYDMFCGCSSLTQAPELPVTELAEGCYGDMFRGCSSLTQVPELPATKLAEDCYCEMFFGCSSLTQVPELPATELAAECYAYMFYGCTSLTEAPDLPVTTLADGCYYAMFCGCTSLTEAPDLPATELKADCYAYMFYGCTSLTETPELPATQYADGCYAYMFDGCSGIEITDTVAEENLPSYFTVSFPDTGSDYANNMFTGTTGDVSTPEYGKTYYIKNQHFQEDSEAALAVDNLINAIGTVTYTQECKNKIDTAAEAYAQLRNVAKAMVTKYAVLTAAQAAYEQIGKDTTAAAEVDTLIDAIGTVTYTAESKQKIDTAANAYNELTAGAKAMVTKYAVLTAAQQEYPIKVAEHEAAVAVDALIDAIGTVTYTAESKQKIDTAANAYNQLTAGAKAMVTKYAVLTAAQARYSELEAAKKKADNIAAFENYKNTACTELRNTYTDGEIQALITSTVASLNYDDNQTLSQNKARVDNARKAVEEEAAKRQREKEQQQQQEQQQQEQQQEQQDKNFFDKILDFFKNLFSKIKAFFKGMFN